MPTALLSIVSALPRRTDLEDPAQGREQAPPFAGASARQMARRQASAMRNVIANPGPALSGHSSAEMTGQEFGLHVERLGAVVDVLAGIGVKALVT